MRTAIVYDTTKRLLGGIPSGREFSLRNLAEQVGIIIDRPEIYPATVGRMIRQLRKEGVYNISCTNRRKSMYVKETV